MLVRSSIKRSRSASLKDQVINADFLDQILLIAVTNGNTERILVTTPCQCFNYMYIMYTDALVTHFHLRLRQSMYSLVPRPTLQDF